MSSLQRQLSDAKQRNRDALNRISDIETREILPLRSRVAELEREVALVRSERDQYQALYLSHKLAMEGVVLAYHTRMLASGKVKV